jgi:GxxExxY protein
MAVEGFKYADITGKVIGCAMKVHSYFGLGFPEVIYQRAIFIELEKAGLKCQSEVEKEICYDERLIGKRRLDLIVEEVVLVEIKAVSELDKAAVNQVLNYLNVFNIEVGLLLNFGCESLQYKRLANTKNQRNPKNPQICD